MEIKCKNITYQDPLLDYQDSILDLTYTFHNNQVYGIIGPSGSGKTTLLHILSGQDMDFEGERSVDGTIEIIEQDIMLFEAMSVQDNLRMVADNIEEITHLLKRFKMTNHAREKVKKLSIGQKKRVQLMRSLLNRPDYLLCDEPTAALDHDNAEIVMQMLKEILPYWYGLLKKGGVLVAILPNIGYMAKEYAKGNIPFEQLAEVISGGQEYEGNYHLAVYDEKKIEGMMKEIGFREINIETANRKNGLCWEMEIHGVK